MPRFVAALGVLVCAFAALPAHAADQCGAGASALGDAKAMAGVRGIVARQCPCADYDGSTPALRHGAFVRCAQAVVDDASDGTAIPGLPGLRRECRGTIRKIFARAACGYTVAQDRVMCCEAKPSKGSMKGSAKKASRCVDAASGNTRRQACYASPFAPDACSFTGLNRCATLVVQETVNVPSAAEPANTPGTTGVVVTNPKLLAQFGGGSFSLNNARYTRHHLAGPPQQPEAILVLVPGFEGGAGDFKIFAENLITRAQGEGLVLEVWAYDRRTNQLEDLAGLDVAEEFLSPEIGLDWLYGGELGLTLNPQLAAGPNRRAVFYDTNADVPFMANWTNLVFSRDIDAVVTAARAAAVNQNVFLGGHSAGTGFTARYAATDFDLTGGGPADPGYAKVRGLVLLEGGGGSTAGAPLTSDSLDRIEAKFDGGLFGAVRDNAGRCVDGVTACTIANEAPCAGQTPPKCTPAATAYSVVAGLLNPRILAAGEITAIQAVLDPNGTENLVRVDQGAPGNNAVQVVPDLATLAALPRSTALGGLGSFVDDDGAVATLASFVATSVGAPGPTVGGLLTWQSVGDGVQPPAVLPNNGPAPTALPAGKWGQEKEVTRFERMIGTFYKGATNFTDLYYPAAGPGTTSAPGLCSAGTCVAGNVGAACSTDANCAQTINLDSSALSIGRGRRDIENLTQAANIDVPVFAVGGTNGLAPVPASFLGFANSIGVCTAPSCDGTPRVVDPSLPNPAFPTFGNVNGGFEVVLAEGFAHVDVLTAQDDADNPIPAALLAFIERNVQ